MPEVEKDLPWLQPWRRHRLYLVPEPSEALAFDRARFSPITDGHADMRADF